MELLQAAKSDLPDLPVLAGNSWFLAVSPALPVLRQFLPVFLRLCDLKLLAWENERYLTSSTSCVLCTVLSSAGRILIHNRYSRTLSEHAWTWFPCAHNPNWERKTADPHVMHMDCQCKSVIVDLSRCVSNKSYSTDYIHLVIVKKTRLNHKYQKTWYPLFLLHSPYFETHEPGRSAKYRFFFLLGTLSIDTKW